VYKNKGYHGLHHLNRERYRCRTGRHVEKACYSMGDPGGPLSVELLSKSLWPPANFLGAEQDNSLAKTRERPRMGREL
jgi:hypothetical protein